MRLCRLGLRDPPFAWDKAGVDVWPSRGAAWKTSPLEPVDGIDLPVTVGAATLCQGMPPASCSSSSTSSASPGVITSFGGVPGAPGERALVKSSGVCHIRFMTPPRVRRKVFEDSDFEGWVWKRSRYLGLWRRRYLVLRQGLMLSFKDRRCEEATEAFATSLIRSVESALQNGLSSEMRLGLGRRTLSLVCDVKHERDEWLRKLAQVVSGSDKQRLGESQSVVGGA